MLTSWRKRLDKQSKIRMSKSTLGRQLSKTDKNRVPRQERTNSGRKAVCIGKYNYGFGWN